MVLFLFRQNDHQRSYQTVFSLSTLFSFRTWYPPQRFSAYANKVTDDIVSHVENMAVSEGRPLVYLTSAKTSKEQTALRLFEKNSTEEGLIFILSVVEYCQTL